MRLLSLFLVILLSVSATPGQVISPDAMLKVGAERKAMYLPQLQNKRVGLVVNQTSRVGQKHLVDDLQAQGVQVSLIFAPEHGFRGAADAGEQVADGVDVRTGVPLKSLYGKHKKPTPEDLQNLDILLFDIQDVGVRYYTYISTMHYVMEAAAENNLPLIILDRPNPNGSYVDGPVLDLEHQSFVGMHPIPLVHGLTVGELALMIKGENWIRQADALDLTVVPVENYTHITRYTLPVPPSPNLPNQQAVQHYPYLGLFEGTVVSVGRGTPFPFQVLGVPERNGGSFRFVPESTAGAKFPPYRGVTCYGVDLREVRPAPYLNLLYLQRFYKRYAKSHPDNPSGFFNPFFTRLTGNTRLQKAIEAGESPAKIRARWQNDLQVYRQLRRKYLIYP